MYFSDKVYKAINKFRAYYGTIDKEVEHADIHFEIKDQCTAIYLSTEVNGCQYGQYYI